MQRTVKLLLLTILIFVFAISAGLLACATTPPEPTIPEEQPPAQEYFPLETVTKELEFYEISSSPFSYDISNYDFDSIVSVTFGGEVVQNSCLNGILKINSVNLSRKFASLSINLAKGEIEYSVIIPLEVADIVIKNADDWTRFGLLIGEKQDSTQFSGKRAILANDVDYEGRDWTSETFVNNGRFLIGGELDGRGYSVSNIKSYNAQNMWGQSIGLFSHINNGTIKNIAFLNVDIISSTGALARNSDKDTKIENVLITGSYEMGDAGDYCGGLIYSASSETVKNVVSLLTISSANAQEKTCAVTGYGGQNYKNVYALKVNGNGYASMYDTPSGYSVLNKMHAKLYDNMNAFKSEVASIVSTLNGATESKVWAIKNGLIAINPVTK